jgi:serine/threonine-protein kinase
MLPPQQFADSLRDRYAFERELGRGGMATVYLARDIRHDRAVALKLLHPELAATIGPNRFLQEIRLTARLQHPHLVPVLDSGEATGQLWYSMPYVEGESLRERLQREIQMPLEAALRIGREVADALEYAHQQGVIHRDIKPENIMLSGDHALVADFGVARVIGQIAGERLTETGIALGTPAYMSPEQATASGRLDGRSDVYALGCVIYEMLAGEPPFTGPTPQAVIAKRFVQPVLPLRQLRPTVPAWVDSAVATALASVPADRFPTAADFAQALAGPPDAADEVTARRHPSSRRRAISARRALSIAALLAAGLAATLYLALRKPGTWAPGTLLAAGTLRERERLLLADFGTRQVDTSLGGVMTEIFRIDLVQSPTVTLMPSGQVAEVLRRMQRPATARLDPALAREVGVREGVKAVVTGEIARAGSQFVLSAQLISAASGEVLTAHRETAPDSTALIAAVDRLSGELRARIGESLTSIGREQPLERVTTTSLAALRLYTRAVRAGDHEGEWLKAISLLDEAVAVDTGFAMAYRTLGLYALNTGQMDRAMRGYSAAVARKDRLTDRERNFTLANYYAVFKYDPRKAISAFEAVLGKYPNEREALNDLSLVYRGLYQYQQAEPLLERALAVDSLYVPAHSNLMALELQLKKLPEATAAYTRAIRLLPDVPFLWLLGIPLAGQVGDYALAEARGEEFKKRFGADPRWRASADRELANVAATRGKLADAERYLHQTMAGGPEASTLGERLADAIFLGTVIATVADDPARGLREVERGLARFPLDSLAQVERPYLTLAYVYQLAGRADQARALLREYERGANVDMLNPKELDLAWGRVFLLERRPQDALRRLREATPDPLSFGVAELGRAHDLAGQADSAITYYERYLAATEYPRAATDATELARIHRRLGELYEERGERDKARVHYASFVALWKDCDPELRPRVTEVRRRLAALGGEPGDG